MSKNPEGDAARHLLDDLDTKALSSDADQPHSVISYDPFTNSYMVKGPYRDAHIAILAAERMKAELNGAIGAPGPPIHAWVAMHFPPDED